MQRAGEVIVPNYRGLLLLCLGLPLAYGQDASPGYPMIRPNQEIRVPDLPRLKARTRDRSDVLLTALDIIFHNHDICCGRDSALEDSAQQADARSIKDIVAKLQGRHLLGDGRPVMVSVIDMLPYSPNPSPIVDALAKKQALLLMWNSRLYVLVGALYDEVYFGDGTRTDTVNKFYLLDTRYSDGRREVTFTRTRDNWGDVQGLLSLTVVAQ
jgi:hypothetical protein